MNILKSTLLTTASLLVFATGTFAADVSQQQETFDISDRISGPRAYIGIGADNVAERQDFDASVYGLIEIASQVYDDASGFRLRASFDASEVGIWGGAGLSFEHVFEESPYYVEASILAGAYTDVGRLDLDHAIEFRSQIAVGYHFENGYDMAIGYSHKSNAGIGDDNPGAEALYLRVGVGF